MPWFKVDDGFYDHPKVDELPLEAVGLWLLAGTYAARQLTDGYVSAGRVRKFGADDSAAQELIDAGLWVADDDGYRFRDWLHYQPSRETVLADRERERIRKAKQRESKRNPPSVPPGVPAGVPVGQRPESQGVSGHPDPTRPDPTRPVEVPKSVARKRATPPPDIFEITDDMRRWAAAKAPGVDLDDETERLLDWARANGRSYKDWKAAWRNWMKNAKPPRQPAARTQPPTTADKLTALNQRIQARREAGIA